MNETPKIIDKEQEILAAKIHCQWSSWMKYLFAQGKFNDDGTWTMELWAVDRWMRQMNSSYENLSEAEKESDRVEVNIYLTSILTGLREGGNG